MLRAVAGASSRPSKNLQGFERRVQMFSAAFWRQKSFDAAAKNQ